MLNRNRNYYNQGETFGSLYDKVVMKGMENS